MFIGTNPIILDSGPPGYIDAPIGGGVIFVMFVLPVLILGSIPLAYWIKDRYFWWL